MLYKSETIKMSYLFSHYLDSLNLSPKTLKNYRSDISHFSGWLIFKIRTWGVSVQELSETIPFLSSKLASEYKNFLMENNVPVKTANRRLSTLRHLARFFLDSQILDFDFMNGITNLTLSKVLKPDYHLFVSNFQRHLESEKVSKNTLKNYLSDVRQFLAWLDAQKQVSSINP